MLTPQEKKKSLDSWLARLFSNLSSKFIQSSSRNNSSNSVPLLLNEKPVFPQNWCISNCTSMLKFGFHHSKLLLPMLLQILEQKALVKRAKWRISLERCLDKFDNINTWMCHDLKRCKIQWCYLSFLFILRNPNLMKYRSYCTGLHCFWF